MQLEQLIGKKLEELTPLELANLNSTLAELAKSVTERQTLIKAEAESKVFDQITAQAGKLMKEVMAWTKLPKLALNPNEAGDEYVCSYIVTKIKSTKAKGDNGGKRAASDVNSGDITINKIAIAMGGIAGYRIGSKEVPDIKAAVKALQVTDSRKCWDLDKAGVSASDWLTGYHPDVVIKFASGIEMTVEEAVKKMAEAREKTKAGVGA